MAVYLLNLKQFLFVIFIKQEFAVSAISHRYGSIYSNLQALHGLMAPGKGGGLLGNKSGIVHLLANGLKVWTRLKFMSFVILHVSAEV